MTKPRVDVHQKTMNDLGVDRETAKIINFAAMYDVRGFGDLRPIKDRLLDDLKTF